MVRVPVTEMALDMGSAKVLNIIMLGAYVGVHPGRAGGRGVADHRAQAGQEAQAAAAEQAGL